MDSKIISNLGGALSFLEAQANSLRNVSKLVDGMSDLTSKMQDGTKTDSDLSAYMEEFNTLRQQLSDERDATFNGIKLHDADATSTPFSIATSSSGGQSITFTQSDFLGNGSVNGGWDTLLGALFSEASVDFNTPKPDPGSPAKTYRGGASDITGSPKGLIGPDWGLSSFQALQEGAAAMIATNASQQAMIRLSVESISSRGSYLDSALSKISDADVAHEVANLARTQITTQAASSAMAQTNLAAEGVVRALWGEPSSGIEWYQPPRMTTSFQA